MDCSRFTELFSGYIDDALDDQASLMLEKHLAVCGTCAEQLRELRACIAALQSLEPIQAPSDFLDRVRQRIEMNKRFRWRIWLKEKWTNSAWGNLPLGVFGLAMAVLLAVFVYKEARQGSFTSPGPVSVQLPVQAPTPMESDRPQESRPGEQLVRKAVPSPPPSSVSPGTGVPSQPMVTAEETKPLRLTLLVGHREPGRMRLAEKEEPRREDRKAAEVPSATSATGQEKETLTRPVPAQPARRAVPSAPGRGMLASRLPADGTSLEKGSPADARVERQQRSPSSSVPHSDYESAGGPARKLDTVEKPERTDPLKVLAELRGIVVQLGGIVEAAKYNDLTGKPETLTTRIPTPSLPQFLDELRRIGRLRGPAEPAGYAPENTTILVQITFEQTP